MQIPGVVQANRQLPCQVKQGQGEYVQHGTDGNEDSDTCGWDIEQRWPAVSTNRQPQWSSPEYFNH